MLIISGIIHILPSTGILGSERLSILYGLSFDDPSLSILMRHRAILFGLLGGFMILAAFREQLQIHALIAGFVSVLSFLALCSITEGYNDAINKIIIADVVALVALLIASAAYIYKTQH